MVIPKRTKVYGCKRQGSLGADDMARGVLHDQSKSNVAAPNKMKDRESSQPGMHERRNGIVKATQAVGHEGNPPYSV